MSALSVEEYATLFISFSPLLPLCNPGCMGSVAQNDVQESVFHYHGLLWSWKYGTEVFNPPLAVFNTRWKEIPAPSVMIPRCLCSTSHAFRLEQMISRGSLQPWVFSDSLISWESKVAVHSLVGCCSYLACTSLSPDDQLVNSGLNYLLTFYFHFPPSFFSSLFSGAKACSSLVAQWAAVACQMHG